ncbi:response regulator [Candidatus Nomurabacteria bacterium]|jgi:DNA-binding response OmpR family regulator|nr:response regulator [Candidatus Saccharibacteria bacterium]MCB9822003.1 response regulator [Candidatus Nomurabacteria bacterium]
MSSTKIAIIEDDIAISQMYRLKFETEGYDVQTAEDGKLGLELLEGFKPKIILLDLMMPEMTGDEMLVELRKKPWGKDIIVIILTNLGEEEAPNILKELNVHSYIVKAEMTPRQVAERVKTALAS